VIKYVVATLRQSVKLL